MNNEVKNGTIKEIEGKPCIYFDGYWVRHYQLHSNTLADKKQMIDQLTRRVFHNVEPGINTPGYRVEEIKSIYEKETCPAKKRVKGAMLAGSFLNRGRDILNVIVQLEEAGINIETNNELYDECGKCFMEALELGKNIKLANGVEGVNELWGEPFRVYSLPIEDFFQSRYIKIAETMAEIDLVTDKLITVTENSPVFSVVKEKIIELSAASKLACETLRSDPIIFEIWPRFVVAKEAFEEYGIEISHVKRSKERLKYMEGYELIKDGGLLLTMLSSLRVPMPECLQNYIKRCDEYLIWTQ
jgi:hypothetical protein